MAKGTPPPGCNRPWTCRAESPQLLWRWPGTQTYPAGGGRPEGSRIWGLDAGNRAPFTYLGFKVNIGGGHFGDLEDADGQRDGTQHEQAVVDNNPSQDRVPDPAIAADTQAWQGVKQVHWGTLVSCKKTQNKPFVCFSYLGDSECIRAPCTNNAQVKFTTRKNILRLRKNNLRGSLGRETRNSCCKIRWVTLQHLALATETTYFCVLKLIDVFLKH